ncbi:MAG TPA: CHASE domain-containing protein [Candidatus Nitrosotenuis sp.]|nr:CHASE domain-containing protein [Candidatus Nitrosotenuis sp.]
MLGYIRDKAALLSSHLITVPLLVGISVASLSIWAMVVSANSLKLSMSQATEEQLQQNRTRINTSMRSYAELANSGIARINSGEIDRSSWMTFIDTFDLSRNYPGVFSYGVAQKVTPENTESFLEEKSNDYGRTFSIFPASERSLKMPVVYIQPDTVRSANGIGFDIYTDEVRTRAMDKAMKEKRIVISDKLELYINATTLEKSTEPSFIMYAPYYELSANLETEEQRTAALKGFVFMSFKANEIFKALLSNNDMSRTGVSVYTKSGVTDQPVYERKTTIQGGSIQKASQTIELYGQTFIFEYDFDQDALVSRAQSTAPQAIIISGLVLALMLSAITFFSLRSRHLKLLFEKEREIKVAKDELLSLASHQLRTPATGVKQYMGMVLQGFAGKITPQQKEFLEKAYESNDRQLRVINDILHLAKIDAGRVVLSKRDFDLSEMIRDVSDEQQQDAKRGGVTMTVRTPKKVIYHGDSHIFRMVLENLVSNAIKYSVQGGEVRIVLRKTKTDYVISISDTGIGIDKKDFPKLFKQFSRIVNEKSHVVSGTGVGLYLAANLTELHGGKIVVSSKLGHGSTFRVLLPREV